MRKRVTLADVAARAGLSTTAVSLVLNDRPGSRLSPEAIERVKDAAAELNYRPNPAARSLRMGKTRTVGFISDNVTVTRYASAMIRGLLDIAEQQDHTVLIAETGSDPERVKNALDVMLDRQADGVILGSMAARLIETPTISPEVPVVLVNNLGTAGHPAVLPDEFVAGHAMARLLLENGHTRIGLIGWSPWAIDDPLVSVTIGTRFAGIQAALDEFEVSLADRVDARFWEPPAGYDGARTLLETNPDLTALICMNDNLAFGAYQALQELGVAIPGDISIVSFDDDEIASYLRPGLTTARIPYEEMGRVAMEMVLAGEPPASNRLVTMPVQLRSSVQRLSAASSVTR